MTAPQLRVEIGFGATASMAGFFVLGGSTLYNPVGPIGTDAIAGTVWTDVTSSISGQVMVTRGRSRETDQFQAGTASFTLRNEDRQFDPSNTAGPWYPGPQPRLQVMIHLNGFAVFFGYIDDIAVDYGMPSTSAVTITCVDTFTVLANMTLRSWTPTAGWTTGQGVTAALDRCGYGYTRNISAGSSTIGANLQDGVSLLDFLQTMARTENGYLYCDLSDTLQFLGRYDRDNSIRGVFTDVPTSDTDIGYTTIQQKSAASLLYNEVVGTRNGGNVAQVATDAASKTQFLPRSLSLGTLENKQDSDVLSLCQYLVGRYSQPEVRFDTITVELAGLSDSQSNSVLVCDLTRTVSVTRTPPGGGSAITKLCMIEGINWSIDVGGSALVTFNLGLLDTRNFVILDDASLGVLDTSKLNY